MNVFEYKHLECLFPVTKREARALMDEFCRLAEGADNPSDFVAALAPDTRYVYRRSKMSFPCEHTFVYDHNTYYLVFDCGD